MKINFPLTLFLIFLPASSFADVPAAFREYCTYGNFFQIANSFERIALVMSDKEFIVFIAIAFLTAMGVWAAMVVGRMLFGGGINNSIIQGLVVIFTGVLVFLAFVKPVGDMAVYDEATNQHKIVSNVPDGVVLLAGIQNTIVKAVVEMIWTSSDVKSFRQNAGGDIFNIFVSVFSKSTFVPSDTDSSGGNLNHSIKDYWKDCGKGVVGSAGGPSASDFSGGTIADVFAKLKSGSVFTTYYGSGVGESVTCTDAHNKIIGEMSGFSAAGTGKKFWTEKCGDAGYYEMLGVTGATSNAACSKKVVDFILLKNSSVTDLGLIREIVIANSLYNYLKTYNSQAIADFGIMSGAAGEGSTSVSWLPIIKGVVFAVYLGLIPFLLILMPTLLFPRVIQFILGIFVFMVAWEICDSILHSYAMDLSLAIIEDVFKAKLSFSDVWMMQGESLKALMVFGKMRWASMTLASVLSMVVAHYGGVAMAHFAGQMNFGGVGAQGGRTTLDPTSRARELNSLPGVMPTEAVSNQYSFAGMQQVSMLGQRSAMTSGMGIMREGGGVIQASDRRGQIDADNFTDSSQRFGAREHIAGETGISREDQSKNMHTSQLTSQVGAATALASIGIGPQFSQAAYSQYQAMAAGVKGRAVSDIMERGEISKDTLKMKDDMLRSGSRNGNIDEAVAAWNTSANPTHAALNDSHKNNIATWYNKSTGQQLNPSELSSSAAITMGLNERGDITPAFVTSQGGYTSTDYASSNKVVGDDYKVEGLLNELSGGNFVNDAKHQVLAHKDNYVQAFSSAMSAYVSEQQNATVGYDASGSLGANVGVGRLGAGASIGKSNIMTKNQIAMDISNKLDHAGTDREARQIMQNEFKSYKNYVQDSFNVPSEKDLNAGIENIENKAKQIFQDVTKPENLEKYKF